MKKTTLIALVITLLCCNLGNALASNIEVPPQGQISSNPNHAEAYWFNQIEVGNNDGVMYTGQDGLMLVMAHSSITKSGSASVKVQAETEANITSIEIGGTIYIQQWKNNKWNTYETIVFEKENRDSASVSQIVSVQRGYYYRVKVVHMARTLYSFKTGHTTTTSVLIN